MRVRWRGESVVERQEHCGETRVQWGDESTVER